ncbi:predicted protein [Naegleria gruberi]|uniref:Predicted protein n=1 Tax=Naegleria gruberi TaxID=5762 RepID=D2VHK2_NAEGR|nr:uncharacterized protein NAEGRDRAFT_49598 [Naegleria gruberi]EFC43693.1 predicted protein [Naegleria gruberi]|eukprot:XP_002676437.1 predicted protein [Naegleria gruberi strain NEG-M]
MSNRLEEPEAEQVVIHLADHNDNKKGIHRGDGKDWLYEKLSEKMKRSCKGFSGKFQLIKSIKLDGLLYNPVYPCGVAFDDKNGVLVISDGSNKRIECFECDQCIDIAEELHLAHLGGFPLKDIPSQILIENKGIVNEATGQIDNALIVCEDKRILKLNMSEIVQKLNEKESLDNIEPVLIIDQNQTSDDNIYIGGANSAALVERDGKKQLLLCCDYGNLFGDLSNGTKDSTFTIEISNGNLLRDGCWLGDGKLVVSNEPELNVCYYNDGKWHVEFSLDISDLTTAQRLLYDENPFSSL